MNVQPRKISSEAPSIVDGPGYAYYPSRRRHQRVEHESLAENRSRAILYPGLRDPNFLVLRERRRIFLQLTQTLPRNAIKVLDVGGRLQPYRSLLKNRLGFYIAVDPVFEGLLNVVAVGEHLPFSDASFDLVICTQVLNYTAEPSRVMSEVRRVLKPDGVLFLSVPAIFPRYHDQRWRFMPAGLLVLLSPFSQVEIIPEGCSIAGLFRIVNLFLDTFIASRRLRALIGRTVFPATNLAGLFLDRFSHGNTQFTTNYTCIAHK